MSAFTSSGASGPPSALPYAAIAVPGRPRVMAARRNASDAVARKLSVRKDGALSAT